MIVTGPRPLRGSRLPTGSRRRKPPSKRSPPRMTRPSGSAVTFSRVSTSPEQGIHPRWQLRQFPRTNQRRSVTEGKDFTEPEIAREEQHVDWSLFGCARKGHVTYAPNEPELRDRLMVPTAGGTAWRCLRCGAFATGGPHGSGPAAAAPLVRRGKELRSELILRVFAVERFLRFLILGVRGLRGVAVHVRPGRYPAGLRQRPAGHPRLVPGSRLRRQPLQAAPVYPALVHAHPARAHVSGHRAGPLRGDRAGGRRRAVAGPAVGRVLRPGGDLDLPARTRSTT